MQFLIRDGKLNCIVTMRSSDVGMGLSYDMFTFACISAEIAAALNESTELGMCYITAGSRHIYQDQMDKLSYLYSNYSTTAEISYKPWATWKWPAIKEVMYAMTFMHYEDRALAQTIARDRLLGAS
jgi:thymidylate synthase